MSVNCYKLLFLCKYVFLSLLPSGTGPLVATYVYCNGAETELGDCYYYTFHSSYCNHQHDVGIKCLGECGWGGGGERDGSMQERGWREQKEDGGRRG